MSGIFGVVSKNNCAETLLYSTDYHSHLGTEYGGLTVLGEDFIRQIHDVSQSQFKSKFYDDYRRMKGNKGIGVISDRDTQPLIMRLKFGEYAMCGAGFIDNQNALAQEFIDKGVVFSEMPNGQVNQIELAAKLINQGKTLPEGIEYLHDRIDGSFSRTDRQQLKFLGSIASGLTTVPLTGDAVFEKLQTMVLEQPARTVSY